MWSGAICSDDAQCKQIVLSITLRERWGTTRYRANKRKVLRFILRLYLWRFCWIIHSMELYLLRTEFITLYGINITVQSTEVFILPSIFPSYKNIVKMKKKSEVHCWDLQQLVQLRGIHLSCLQMLLQIIPRICLCYSPPQTGSDFTVCCPQKCPPTASGNAVR